MKKIILLSLLVLRMITFSFAGNAPEVVTSAFNKKFPKATVLKWDKENAHNYEAQFVWSGVNYSANFNDKGEWLETESPLTFKELPEKVQAAFTSLHNGEKVKAVSQIETAKGTIKYEVEIKKGIKTIELFYLADGRKTKE